MKYKLLAIDVDGTLLDREGRITARVKEAVQKAVAAGCLVTLATGRRQRPARAFAAELDLKIPLILYTGSLVYDTQTNAALLHQPMPAEFLQKAIELVRRAGFRPAVLQSPLQGEYIYLGPIEDDDEYSRCYAEGTARVDMVRRCRDYAELAAIPEPLILSVPGSKNIGPQLAEAIRAQTGWSVFSYSLRHQVLADLYGFDIIQPGVSKGNALRWLAHHFGIDPTQTIAIGDGHNDIELLKAAGFGIAMSNADPELKAVADAITAPNWQDGVADAIEKYVL